MLYHFESTANRLILQLPDKLGNVEFQGNTFVTDDEKIANGIRSTTQYQGDKIWEIEGEIAQEKRKKRKYTIHQGARGTDTNTKGEV